MKSNHAIKNLCKLISNVHVIFKYCLNSDFYLPNGREKEFEGFFGTFIKKIRGRKKGKVFVSPLLQIYKKKSLTNIHILTFQG